jgi:hypothetical protein
MPWSIAAPIVAAGVGAAASNSASKGQQGAAGAATDLARSQYTDTVERNQPFLQAGTDALAMLQQKLPTLNSGYDPAKLTSEPGYQFGLQQGQQALERSLAARGRGVSGAALKAASEFGTNYGTTKLNDAFSRDQAAKQQSFGQLQALTQIGQSSANNTSAAGQGFAAAAGQNGINAADSAGANIIGQGNQLQGLINQGVSLYGRSGGGASSTPGYSYDQGSDGAGGYYSNEGRNYPIQLADGGPVRAEPRVGSRTPLPGGSTSGGMSREAILAALSDAHAQGQQRSGIGALPANPVTNPGAINDARMRSAGAYASGGAIRGPGGPTDDAIPARLSDGEHVFDAEAVTALGDGDNEKGQALLNEMRHRIKAHRAGQKRKH